MGRVRRVEFAGAVFHVWLRRLERWKLFCDDDDYGRYVARLAETAAKYGWVVHEFCLMPNHIHLLIELSEPNLGKGLHYLHRVYVRWYNDRHDRGGRLFEHRPQWKAVVDEIYLATVINYVGRNPVDAGLCDVPEEWPWGRRGWIALHGHAAWLGSDEQTHELKDGTRFRL